MKAKLGAYELAQEHFVLTHGADAKHFHRYRHWEATEGRGDRTLTVAEAQREGREPCNCCAPDDEAAPAWTAGHNRTPPPIDSRPRIEL